MVIFIVMVIVIVMVMIISIVIITVMVALQVACSLCKIVDISTRSSAIRFSPKFAELSRNSLSFANPADAKEDSTIGRRRAKEIDDLVG